MQVFEEFADGAVTAKQGKDTNTDGNTEWGKEKGKYEFAVSKIEDVIKVMHGQSPGAQSPGAHSPMSDWNAC